MAGSVSCCCWGHCCCLPPVACCQLLLLLPNTTLTNVNPLRLCQWPNTSQQSPAELPRLPYCPCVRSFVFTCCGRDCVLAATCNLIGQRRRRLSQRQLVKCNDLDLPARQMGVRTANCQSAACTGAGVGQLATGNNLIKQVAAPKSLRSPLHSLSVSSSLSLSGLA